MSRAKQYDYERIDLKRETQDQWYLQRRKELAEENDVLQTQLQISQPGDMHEVQADQIARNFVNGSDASLSDVLSAASSLQTTSESTSAHTDSNFNALLGSTKGTGQALSDSMRNEMESKMGADLSSVRIHTGSAAHALSESINAKAFTHGQDVYFKNGNYDSNSNQGKELLAHEVVHTVQQGRNGRSVQRKTDVPIELYKDDRTAEEKVEWLQNELEAIWLWAIPIRYFISRKKAFKAYSYLCQISLEARKDFFKDYPDAIEMILQSLPAGVYEAANFGFVTGISDANTRTVDMLNDASTWEDPSLTYTLLLTLAQPGVKGYKTEQREKDQLPQLTYNGKVQELIDAHKETLLLKLESPAFWSGPENDVTAAVAILVMGGYSGEAQVKVSAQSAIPESLRYPLNDLLSKSPVAEIRGRNTLLNLALAYIRSRSQAKEEFKDELQAEIDAIKKLNLPRAEERKRIRELRKEKGKFKDQYTSLFGAVGHFAVGSKKEAHLNNLDILELQKGLGDQMMGYGIIFSDQQATGKNYGRLNYNADLRKGEVSVTSNGLPFSSINYAGADYTFRTENGLFGGVDLQYKWPGLGAKKAEQKPDDSASGTIDLKLNDLVFNNMRILFSDQDKKTNVQSDYSYSLGKVTVKGLRVHIEQSFGPSVLWDDPSEFLSRTSYILMNTMKLLTYAIQRSINRFVPGIGESAGDTLKQLMSTEFSDNLFSHIHFDSLEILDLYSTEHGAIESITTGLTMIDVASLNSDPAMMAKKYELNRLQSLPERKLKKNKNGEQEKIAELQKEIDAYYANQMFSLDMAVTDLNIKNRNLLQTALSSDPSNQSAGLSYEAGEIGPIHADYFGFSSNFTSQKLSQTSVWLRNITIDVIDLKKIRMADPGYKFGGSNSVVVKKINGDITIHFKDEEKDAAKSKQQGLIERIEVPRLSIEEVVAGGFEYSNYQTFRELRFPDNRLVKVKGITVLNAAFQSKLNADKNAYELVPEILDKSLPATIDIGSNLGNGEKGIEIPAGISYQNKDAQGRILLGLTTGNITGASLHVDIFDDGSQLFDFNQLAGDVTVQGSDKKDPFTAYSAHLTLDSEHVSGRKKGNVLTFFNLDIPGVEFDQLMYKTNDTLFRTGDHGKVVLSDIKSIGDVVLTMTTAPPEKDPRPFERLEIPELKIGLIAAEALELYLSADKGVPLPVNPDTENSTYFIVEPGKGGAKVHDLTLKPFTVINELLPQSQDDINNNVTPKYKTYYEGEMLFGTNSKKDPPGIEVGDVAFGTWNKDATKIIQGSLDYLNVGNGTIGFSIIEAQNTRFKNKKQQKTSFTIDDILGKGTYWQSSMDGNKNVSTVNGELQFDIDKVKGSYDAENLIIDELFIPSAEFGALGYAGTDLSVYFVGEAGQKIAVQSIVARGIKVAFDVNGNAQKIGVDRLDIKQISSNGELHLSTGLQSGDKYKEFIFPAGGRTTIKDIFMDHCVMQKKLDQEGEYGWLIQEKSKMGIGPVKIPKGVALRIADELRLNLDSVSANSFTLEGLEHGGFKYTLLNLDTSGFYQSGINDPKQIATEFGLNTTEVSGEVTKGYDEKVQRWYSEYKVSTIDIPSLSFTGFNFYDPGKRLTVDVPEQTQRKSSLNSIKGDFSLRVYHLTKDEKAADKTNGTKTKTRKVIHCNKLHASQLRVFGLGLEYNAVKYDIDNVTLMSDMLYKLKMPLDIAATIADPQLTGFDIVLSETEGEDALITGKVTAGDRPVSAAVDIPTAGVYVKNNMTNFFARTHTSLIVDTITFQGKGKGFEITIDKTSGQWAAWPASTFTFPFNYLPAFNGVMFGNSETGAEGVVSGQEMDQFFWADKIKIVKNDNGEMVITVSDPIISSQEVYYSFGSDENIKEGEMEYIRMRIGGALEGDLIVKSSTKDNIDTTTMEAGKGDIIKIDVPEVEIGYKHKTPHKGEFANDLEGLEKYNEDKDAEKTDKGSNKFDFLDGVVPGGTVTVTMIWNDVYSDGTISELSSHPIALTIVDINGEHGFFPLRQLIEGIATYFDEDSGGNIGYFAERPLANLSTDEDDHNNLVLESLFFQNLDTILVPDYSHNVKRSNGREYVRLSAFAHYNAYKRKTRPSNASGISAWLGGEAESAVKHVINKRIMDFNIGIDNVQIDLAEIPKGKRGMLNVITAERGTIDVNAGISMVNEPYTKTQQDIKENVWQEQTMGLRITAGSMLWPDKFIDIPAFDFKGENKDKRTSYSISGTRMMTPFSEIQYKDFHMEQMNVKVPFPVQISGLKITTTSPHSYIQKKSLSIGSTNDPLEHEADNIASKVADGQNADLAGVSRFFSGVQRKEKEEEAPLDLVDSLEHATGGQSMDAHTRAEMESRMGVDLSGVQIHTGTEAHSYNEQVNAQAFTLGQSIFFRNGNYNPHTKAGKELLAHELVHTVQQSGQMQRKIMRKPVYKPGLHLQSIWFRNISQLETTFDGQFSFTVGEQGVHVQRIQQTLQELQWQMNWVDETGKDFVVKLGTSGDDGIFGEKTFNSLKGTQKKLGLPGSGIVDSATMKKFDSIFWNQTHLPRSYNAIKLEEKESRAKAPAVVPETVWEKFERIKGRFKLVVDKYGLHRQMEAMDEKELDMAERLLTNIENWILFSEGYPTSLMWGGLRYDAYEGQSRLAIVDAEHSGGGGQHMAAFDLEGKGLLFQYYRSEEADAAMESWKEHVKGTTINSVPTMIKPHTGADSIESDLPPTIPSTGMIQIGSSSGGTTFSGAISTPGTQQNVQYPRLNSAGNVIYEPNYIDSAALLEIGIDTSLLTMRYVEMSESIEWGGGCRYEVTYNGMYMGYFEMGRIDGNHDTGEVEQFKRAYAGQDPIIMSKIKDGSLWKFAIGADTGGDPDFLGTLLQVGFPKAQYGMTMSMVLSGAVLDAAGGAAAATAGGLRLWQTWRAQSQAAKAAATQSTPKTNNSAGQTRAATYGANWQSADLDAAIKKFAGPNPHIFSTGQKTVYRNASTGIQVVVDEAGGYFRIENTNLTGSRVYTNLNGEIPNNKIVGGKQMGRSQAEYNEVTHFKFR